METFGFIITRHVNSIKTNKYWNHCVKCLKTLYPLKKIVIIDDNSKKEFLSADFEYKNVEIVESEFHGRGELLPFYYFLKFKYFDNAVIIHDSVFFHKRVHFEKLIGMKVIPMWHFVADNESLRTSIHLTENLKNSYIVQKKLSILNDGVLGLNHLKWYGCFGVQCFISLSFLSYLENKYNITSMIQVVKNRRDRTCLERIFGVLFYTENLTNLQRNTSILGSIYNHKLPFKYTYDLYEKDLKQPHNFKIIKVWTGR